MKATITVGLPFLIMMECIVRNSIQCWKLQWCNPNYQEYVYSLNFIVKVYKYSGLHSQEAHGRKPMVVGNREDIHIQLGLQESWGLHLTLHLFALPFLAKVRRLTPLGCVKLTTAFWMFCLKGCVTKIKIFFPHRSNWKLEGKNRRWKS